MLVYRGGRAEIIFCMSVGGRAGSVGGRCFEGVGREVFGCVGGGGWWGGRGPVWHHLRSARGVDKRGPCGTPGHEGLGQPERPGSRSWFTRNQKSGIGFPFLLHFPFPAGARPGIFTNRRDLTSQVWTGLRERKGFQGK